MKYEDQLMILSAVCEFGWNEDKLAMRFPLTPISEIRLELLNMLSEKRPLLVESSKDVLRAVLEATSPSLSKDIKGELPPAHRLGENVPHLPL